MSTNIGSAVGTIEIGTSGAQGNILGLDTALMNLGQSMIGLNPLTLTLGAGLIGLGVAAGGLAGGIVSSVNAADKLDTILDGVQANMQISAGEVSKLKDLVSDLGVDPNLKVSSFEAAEAIEMLGRNGLKVDEILNGAARSTVLLANATGGTFSQSADIATDVMALFGIEAADMNTAVDGITSVVNSSKFSINDYALALAQGGGVAASVGVEFDDFNTTIAGIAPLFASGSDAGTSFKVFLQRLIPQSKKAAGVMKELGLMTEDGANRFFDANGNLKDMADIAELLQGSLAGLSEEQRNSALSTIFGTDAMRAAVGLMGLGADGFRDLQTEMGETDAAMAAALRMDNLTGDLEILNGIIETLKIRIGNEWLPLFREVIQGLTDFLSVNGDSIVNWFAELSDMAGEAIPAIRGFADNGISYLLTFWEQVSAAFEQGGLAGVLTLLGENLQAGWTETIYPVLADWGTRFWDWITGASEGTGSLNTLLESITTYLNENWPVIGAALTKWSENFWQWAADATQKVGEVLGPLVQEMQAWATSDEAQQRLTALGVTMGNILWDSLALIAQNSEAAGKVLFNLAVSLGKAAIGLMGAWQDIGAAIGAGIISGLTGVEVDSDILKNISNAGLMAMFPGYAQYQSGKQLLDSLTPTTPQSVAPPTAETNALLQQLIDQNKGQAYFTVSEDSLRQSGFIHQSDFSEAYR
jgi:TP901 family phage tail tape measure protein